MWHHEGRQENRCCLTRELLPESRSNQTNGNPAMKMWRVSGLLVLLLIAAGSVWLGWEAGAPRRASVAALQHFNSALSTGNSADLLNAVVMPVAIQGRTAPEQAEFLTKALRDEISAEGLAVLQREGAFGPLTSIFPAEAERWATQAGVKPEDCVAFKLKRNGLRAEVVLARPSTLNAQPSTAFELVRCNNVKQLAAPPQP
jgi:hypothetical protein